MKPITAYAWTGTEMLALQSVYEVDRRPFFNMPLVDLAEKEPRMRYGTFEQKGWFPIPFDQFPPEFRVQLLLLGIS